MDNMTMNAPRRRPLGITIIAVLTALSGILAVIGALTVLFAVGSGAIGIVLVVFALIIGIANLVLAYGLWTLKPWAFWATVILEAIGLVLAIVNIATGRSTFAAQAVSIIIAAIIIIYMFADSKVRPAFHV